MWYCYVLKNSYYLHKDRTYVGFTTDPKKRIRQHNQEIKGGAKYTSIFGNKSWYIYFLISGFPDKITALQFEWRLKNPPKKRYGPKGRIQGVNDLLKLNKWTNNSMFENDMYDINIWIMKEYAHLLTDIPDNVHVNVTDDIQLCFSAN
jgi:predicted GIY-YIG superfamily endonuclease